MVFDQLQENMVSLSWPSEGQFIFISKLLQMNKQQLFFLFYGFYVIARGTKPLLPEQSKDKVIDVITHI